MTAKERKSVYDIVAERIMAALEEGVIPWRKPWKAELGWPRNLHSKKAYKGINVWMLMLANQTCPYWLSFKQIQDRGGKVRKGEHGTPVVFWKPIKIEDEDNPGKEKTIPLLRYYLVFNLEQCEGIEIPEAAAGRDIKPIEACEGVVANMPGRPEIKHGGGKAFYSPVLDYVGMPKQKHFDSDEEYYSVLFHELTHSTGHKDRLNRESVADCQPFGTPAYGREELVAEMGAAFLCAYCGIEDVTLKTSAAYIDGWLNKIKEDKRMLVVAAGAAQKAADFILNARAEEIPGEVETCAQKAV